MCRFSIGSSVKSDFDCRVSGLVLPRLTGNLPSHSLPDSFDHSSIDFHLADKDWMKSRQVDMLIGGDIYPEILLAGLKKNILGTLIAQETVFGWILTGPLQTRLNQPPTRIVSFFNEVALDDQLKRFWELEELPRRKYLTEDETCCEKLFEETTVRKDDGRYEFRLPFKPEADKTLLYDSKVVARSVFQAGI